MIIRKDQPQNDQGTENRSEHYGAFELLRYSEAGGLTQFGAYVETLQPGSRSSDRHWHEEEDEFLYLLSGEANVIEEDGAHLLLPGDAACWPAGTANAHHVVNRSKAPCTYLIVGTRAPRDVVHYPDLGQVLYNEGDRWRLLHTDGTLLSQGDSRTRQDRQLITPDLSLNPDTSPAALARRPLGAGQPNSLGVTMHPSTLPC